MHDCPFLFCNFFQKRVAKNIPVIRVGVYIVALSLFSLFFLGGVEGFFKLLQNCSMFSATASDNIITLNSSGVFTAIEILTGVKLYGVDFILSSVLFVLLLLLSFFVQEKWKRVLLVALALLNGFTVSFMYMGVFLLLPWAYFITVDKKDGKMKYAIYTIIFLVVLSPLPMGQADKALYYTTSLGETEYIPVSYKSIISAVAVTALSIYTVFDVLRSVFYNRYGNRHQRVERDS